MNWAKELLDSLRVKETFNCYLLVALDRLIFRTDCHIVAQSVKH